MDYLIQSLETSKITLKYSYVFAWTCKNTNPKANPKIVIAKHVAAVVKISPSIFLFI